MGYTVAAGSVYKFVRSLKHPDMYAFQPGDTEPEVVEVDDETANEMQFTGALVYLDGQTVAIFEHMNDKHFILGMPVDPEAQAVDEPTPEEVLEEILPEPVAEPQGETLPAEQMTEWGYDWEHVCECGYYTRDHAYDGSNLLCPTDSA